MRCKRKTLGLSLLDGRATLTIGGKFAVAYRSAESRLLEIKKTWTDPWQKF